MLRTGVQTCVWPVSLGRFPRCDGLRESHCTIAALQYPPLLPPAPLPSAAFGGLVADRPTPHLFLGLDISNHNTGYAVLDARGRALAIGGFRSNKSDSYDRAAALSRHIARLDRIFGDTFEVQDGVVWDVALEDYMRHFRAGRFQTKSLFQLAETNCCSALSCWQTIGIKPLRVHPTSARACFKLSSSNTRDGIKDVVVDHVRAQLEAQHSEEFSGHDICHQHLSHPACKVFGLGDDPASCEDDGRQHLPWSAAFGSPADLRKAPPFLVDMCDAYVIARYLWTQHQMHKKASNQQLRLDLYNQFIELQSDSIRRKLAALQRLLKNNRGGTSAEIETAHLSANARFISKFYKFCVAQMKLSIN